MPERMLFFLPIVCPLCVSVNSSEKVTRRLACVKAFSLDYPRQSSDGRSHFLSSVGVQERVDLSKLMEIVESLVTLR